MFRVIIYILLSEERHYNFAELIILILWLLVRQHYIKTVEKILIRPPVTRVLKENFTFTLRNKSFSLAVASLECMKLFKAVFAAVNRELKNVFLVQSLKTILKSE